MTPVIALSLAWLDEGSDTIFRLRNMLPALLLVMYNVYGVGIWWKRLGWKCIRR